MYNVIDAHINEVYKVLEKPKRIDVRNCDMELVKGRPQNTAERLEREVRVYDLLDSLGIEYDRTDHEEANTMEACNEIDRILGATICKNLFLCNRQRTQFYLLMMPGEKVFKTKDLLERFLPAVHHEPMIVELPDYADEEGDGNV